MNLGTIGGQLETIAQELVLNTYRRLDGNWHNSEWEIADKFNLLNVIRQRLNPFMIDADYRNQEVSRFIGLANERHGWKIPEHILWAFPSAKAAYSEQEISWNSWPVSTYDLAEYVESYAKFYPNSSPTLEHILISALIYGETWAFGETIKPLLKGPFLFALSGGSELKLVLMKSLLELVVFFLRIAFIVGVGIIATKTGDLTAGLLAAFFAFFLININSMLGQNALQNRRMKTETLLLDMQTLSHTVDVREPVPSYVRYILELTTKNGVV